MNKLPLPNLEEAKEVLYSWLTPISDEKTLLNTKKAVEKFIKTDGETLYQGLAAQNENKKNNSWFIDIWKKKQLTIKESLPFSGNNITSIIDWQSKHLGLKRAAYFLSAMLKLIFIYKKDKNNDFAELRTYLKEFPNYHPDYCFKQWDILNGGGRKIGEKIDEWVEPENDEINNLHIVIFFEGAAFKIQISDENGNLANPAQIENALYEIINFKFDKENDNFKIPFTAPSLLEKKIALEIKAQLLSRTENNLIMQNLEKSLFCLALDNKKYNPSEAYFNAAFNGDNFWVYKALNFCLYLENNRYFAKFDQYVASPYIFNDIIAVAQKIANQYKFLVKKNNLADNLNLQNLSWKIEGSKGETDTGTYKLLSQELNKYKREAENFVITAFDIFITPKEKELLNFYPKSAIVQLMLQTAYLYIHKNFLSISNFVDMRNYYNGRHDLISSVSKESKIFCKKLISYQAQKRDLDLAVESYIHRVAQSKNGEGIFAFWLGMLAMAKAQEISVSLFNDEGILSLLNPAIRSIDTGSQNGGQIIFPPENKDSISLSYAVRGQYFHFIFTHLRNKTYEISKFTKAMNNSLKAILLLISDK